MWKKRRTNEKSCHSIPKKTFKLNSFSSHNFHLLVFHFSWRKLLIILFSLVLQMFCSLFWIPCRTIVTVSIPHNPTLPTSIKYPSFRCIVVMLHKKVYIIVYSNTIASSYCWQMGMMLGAGIIACLYMCFWNTTEIVFWESETVRWNDNPRINQIVLREL